MRAYEDLKIAVAGTGYVGMSIATLLAQHHEVIAVDVVPEKVEKINQRISPIQDEYIERYLAEKPLRLTATLDAEAAYKEADIVVIAAPTNYDPVKNFFDTHHIEDVIDLVLQVNPGAVMGTVTGRLSSTDPNLQNIPTRTEEGKQIRRIFEPGAGFDYLDLKSVV